YVIWSGALSDASVQMLIRSPLRQEISQKLVEGNSAVWVFLESGDKQRDDKAYSFVEGEVARLQRELELPELDENAERETIYLDESLKTELGISFSLLRLSRDNKEEQALIAMMLGSEIDLPLYADQPMVFPIFGQGRLLYALIGEGINSETMQDAGQFLVGPCSCQIKDENPGVDMLMPIVWSDHIKTEMVRDRPLPAPIPALGGINATGELVALQTTSKPNKIEVNPVLINLGYSIAGFILVSMAATAVIFLRKQN
ncbi:hypothetical protein K8I31_01520, partial [bacterium]|nr:hypothetical protein [bacterium]